MKIDHIAIAVDDVEESAKIYQQALGADHVEFDASSRALVWLKSSGITGDRELTYASDALKWAASTYVVAALAAVTYLLYYVAMLRD